MQPVRQELKMFRVAAVLWIMLATMLAGLALLVIVATPSLAKDALRLLPIACSSAAIAAMPLSYLVAWRISREKAA
jgi:hypothetical protein